MLYFRRMQMNFRNIFACAVALFLMSCAHSAHTQVIAGRVTGVLDGDSITLLDTNNRQYNIRLGQIDAPEFSQSFGRASKKALSGLVFGKQVEVNVETTDQYGRTVGKVLVNGQDANLAQVRNGMAWVYRQYAHEPAYFAAENAAKAARTGLWSKPDPIPPWVYRHGGDHGWKRKP